MTEDENLLLQSLDRFLERRSAGRIDDAAIWAEAAAVGLPLAMAPEALGGFGAGPAAACALIERLGAAPSPVPLAEALMAGRLLGAAGLAPLDGPVTLAPYLTGELKAGGFTGVAEDVPAFEQDYAVVGRLGGDLVVLGASAASARRVRLNMAGEPREALTFAAAPVLASAPARSPLTPFDLGALVRGAQIAGAMRGALKLVIEHTTARQQFGRALSGFQVVQHAIAVLAAETNLIEIGAQAAFAAADYVDSALEIGALKLRSAQAAKRVFATTHQLHGAIGFTREHPLHHLTSRLISWAAEFGTEDYWARRLAAFAVEAGPEKVWDLIIRHDTLVAAQD
jgi:acyl-CoA dehydrogenase